MARTPIHPGEHLSEALSALGISARQLAAAIAVPPNRITAILKGERAVSADTALRLGHFFGTSPQFWLNLQQLHDLRLAQRRLGRAVSKLGQAPRLQSAPRSAA